MIIQVKYTFQSSSINNLDKTVKIMFMNMTLDRIIGQVHILHHW